MLASGTEPAPEHLAFYFGGFYRTWGCLVADGDVPAVELFKLRLADGYELPPVMKNAYPMVLEPSPSLRQVSVSVDPEEIQTYAFKELVARMCVTMYANGGIGLAAPQIGVNKRFFVFDTMWPQDSQAKGKFDPKPQVVINPRVIAASDIVKSREGCLSVGCDFHDYVDRLNYIEVEGTVMTGEEKFFRCLGLVATCFQHEIEHLDGILFIDHLSSLKRDRFKRRRAKLMRRAKRVGDQLIKVETDAA
jgi:peptide deformylase